MLWYNNPHVVSTLHEELMESRRRQLKRRAQLRLAANGSAVARH